MGREIRRVPENWRHPKNEKGYYEPLRDNYVRHLKYYKEEVDQFIASMTEVIEKGQARVYSTTFTEPSELYDYLTEDALSPPHIYDYMPSGPWYQLFENVSEGTPITPPFATPEELIQHLTTKGDEWNSSPWTQHQAEQMVKQGYAPSGVMTGGKMYDSRESLDLP